MAWPRIVTSRFECRVNTHRSPRPFQFGLFCRHTKWGPGPQASRPIGVHCTERSEEHTSELQSQSNLVCRLLLEKKKKITSQSHMGNDICNGSHASRFSMCLILCVFYIDMIPSFFPFFFFFF